MVRNMVMGHGRHLMVILMSDSGLMGKFMGKVYINQNQVFLYLYRSKLRGLFSLVSKIRMG